ncbi:MAG: Ig-like domain-containing protein, partial [Bacilli bacterium]|nr:Ig-like domain-containing protein [Bacilli bacterium]
TKGTNINQYVTITDTTALNAIKSHISIAGSYEHITRVVNLGGNRYHLYSEGEGAYVPAEGDILVLEEGLPIYQWSGATESWMPSGMGQFEVVEEFKEEHKFVYTNGAWAVYQEPVPTAEIKNLTPGDGFGADTLFGANFFFETKGINIDQYVGIMDPVAAADIKAHILIAGSHDNLTRVVNIGGNRYHLYCEGGYSPLPGDTLILQKGLRIYQYTGTVVNWSAQGDGKFKAVEEFQEDVKFIYTGNAAGPWVVFDESHVATDFTLTKPYEGIAVGEEMQLSWKVEPATAIGTPVFTSSNPEVATVSADGKVVGVSVGEVTITAKLGDVTRTVTVSISAAKDVKGVVATKVPEFFAVKKGSDASAFSPNITSYKLQFVDGTFSPEYTCDPSMVTVGKPDTSKPAETEMKVSLKIKHITGVEYTGEIGVKIYEEIAQKISEVAIVDWFAYATFIELPNTCSNVGNITASPELNTYMENISYTRADGTPVKVGFYQLGENIAILPEFMHDKDGNPALTEENYKADGHYMKGDTITIKAMTPIYYWTGLLTGGKDHIMVEGTGEIIIQGYIETEQIYKFNGDIWARYEKFDDIAVESEEVTCVVGKTMEAGFSRSPATATEGTFTYSSDNEAVVTVNPSGMITGVSEGTAHVTATLTSQEDPTKVKTKTITVHVVDGVVSAKITNATEDNPYKVTLGNDLDPTKLTGVAVYGSGKEEAIDMSGATVEGFNKDELGVQTVVVKVKIGGEEFSVRATIEVVNAANSLGLIIGASAGGAAVVAGAVVAVVLIKKKKKSI